MPSARKLLKTLAALPVLFVIFCFLFGNYFWIVSPSIHQKLQIFQLPLNLPEGEDGPIPVGKDIINAETGWVISSPDWLDDNIPCKPIPGKADMYERELWIAQGKRQEFPWRRTFDVESLEYEDIRAFDIVYKDETNNTIELRDSAEQTIWTINAPYTLRSSLPEQVYVFGNHIVISTYEWSNETGSDRGLMCVDHNNGKLLWKVLGPSNHVSIQDDKILATSEPYSNDKKGSRAVLGTRLKDGSEVFRTVLPSNFYTEGLLPYGDNFVVWGMQDNERGVEYNYMLFDNKGSLLRTLEGEVLDTIQTEGNTLLLTSFGLTKLSAEGAAIWETTELEGGRLGGGSLQILPNGDILGMSWGAISADEETVARISPEGKTIWSAKCGGHVTHMHSAYWHTAHIESRGDYFFVIGQGMHGHTITVLDKETGNEKRRWMYRTAK